METWSGPAYALPPLFEMVMRTVFPPSTSTAPTGRKSGKLASGVAVPVGVVDGSSVAVACGVGVGSRTGTSASASSASIAALLTQTPSPTGVSTSSQSLLRVLPRMITSSPGWSDPTTSNCSPGPVRALTTAITRPETAAGVSSTASTAITVTRLESRVAPVSDVTRTCSSYSPRSSNVWCRIARCTVPGTGEAVLNSSTRSPFTNSSNLAIASFELACTTTSNCLPMSMRALFWGESMATLNAASWPPPSPPENSANSTNTNPTTSMTPSPRTTQKSGCRATVSSS